MTDVNTETAAPSPDPLTYPDEHVRAILHETRTVAVVGASGNTVRPSYFVVTYLRDKGFTVFPINPGLAGKEIAGLEVYASLADVPAPIDMVDIFRNSDAAGGVVEEALALDPLPKTIWMQLGVRNDAAARRAEQAGISVIMDRCPKIEFGRLSGEIGWVGVNSRTISSRKPVLNGTGYQQFGLRPGKTSGR